ncbi:cadherin domain-containing protein [Gimesia aquarii]|uniref:Cadherin domain protein n=1 Tax=Gimesia aquarii TaxID=2527964 RepID=A0A517VWK0_9PLAN|nr:cadherin domain-containing protein [Gimesia aquarii]QDT97380.1 Cadherin domain protein [Gimesia aquarii]
MGLLKWLNRYLGKTEVTPNLQFDSFREDSNANLELIRLEDRIVLSVSAGVTGDVLELNLDTANDEATVSVVDSGATIQVDDGLGLPDSILQFDASQISSILVTGTDSSQIVNFLGQEDLVLSGTVDTTSFTGDVNIGIELLVGPGESPQFNSASTVTYLGQFELSGDQLNVILPNVLNADDAFVIQINGPNLEILDPDLANPLLFSTPAGSLSSINVFGTDGETDFLTLDYSSSGLTDITISFDGGTGGNDALEFSNGVFDTITHNLTGPGTGSVDFSGNGITEITYTGLEPVFGGSSTANDVVINLPNATLDAVLENSLVPGEMQIRSLSAAFELTTFASPTDSLTINTSGGSSVVTLNSFDTTFAPNDLIISGQSGDTYQLTGSDLLADTVTLTLSGGATLDLGAFDETVDGFVLEEGTVIATSGILSTQSDLDLRSGTVQAQLNGTNLIKNSMGTVVLSGTSSAIGSTSVQGGLLRIEGSLTTSEVIVSTGAVLGGNGTVDAPVTVNNGGVLTPGSSPGIISTGDLTLSAGSTLDIEIDGTTAGTDYDQIQVTGTVDLTGATLNLISAFTAAAGNEFLLIENDGADAITGTFAGLPEGTLLTFNGNQVYITYQGGDGNDVALTVNTPPVVNNQLFDIDENTSNSTSLGTIVSTDPDVPPDSLAFSVTGGTGQTAFAVSTSGEITVADESQLDFETTTSFDLEILVTDSAGATDTATITIDLNPLNDNAPVAANQIRSVDENAINGTNVGAVIVATDDDLPGDTLTFSETGGTGAAAFDITSDGQIVVADQSLLDFETNPTFTLDILVDDNAGLTTPATITIDLNPLNDNAPVVANQIRSVDENAINGTNVGAVIVATDDDLPGDTLTFSETGGTGSAAFDITSDGQIVVADQSLLDFETNPTFTLDILVDDNAGLTTPATITINLNDLVETLVVDSADWSVNDITLVRDGSQLRVLKTGTLNEIVPSHNFTNVSSVVITGNGLDNTVRLYASGGNIIPAGGINFDGGIGSDTLVASDQVNDWDIDGVNAGSLLSDSVTFTSVENLTGNDDADTFVIQAGGQIDGTINGGAGIDHIDLSNETTDLSVILTSLGSTDGFDGNESATSTTFQNIDQITGSTGTNSLTGIDSAANWTINGTNSYQSTNTLEFSNFINLIGGSDSDSFNVTPDTEAFNIVGGDPTSNPLGDQLNVDTSAAGTALVTSNSDGSGSVSGTFPTITYSEIEDFAISGIVDVQIDGTTNNDTIEILVVGADIEYRLGGILIGTSSLTQTNSITVNAGDGDDSLTVDSALAAQGITVDYDGEGQTSTNPGDVLNLLGTATSVEYFFTDITSGSIRIDGALTDFITYTGLEPITSTINATNVTLNYSGVTETITISDAGGSQTTVTSTAGEMLTFSDPTNSLTINTGDGDDIIDINSLTASFTASLIINGNDGADTLNANASVSLDAGNNIEFNVETINVANGIALTATGIALNAAEVNLDGDLVSTNVSGDAITVNVLGSTGGADIQDAVDVAGNGGIINVAAGVYITADTLDIDESVSILGAGGDVVEIRKTGDPTSNFDVAVNITADNVTISGAQLGWETHTSATDYQGYVVLTTADNTTLNSLLFGDNYRSAVVFVGADNLEVSDSIFEGKFGRAAIRDGSGGSGENFLITRNEFRADHFRWGPIAIGPQGTFGNPNNFAFSGVISFNYFGNGLEAGAFQEAGDQNYTVTITNGGMTADGIDIIHNTFDWQDSATTNANGIFAQPGGIFFDPSLSVPVGTVNITDNIFNGFTYLGPQPTTEPLWNPTGGVFGGALEFDGVDDFGLFQDATFDVGESGTLSFWVNMDDQGRRNQFFEGLNSAGFEFQFRSNSGGQFFGSPGRAGNSNNFVIQDGSAGGTEGVWQNLQYTWDFNGGVNPQMHIYIDGVEVGYLNTTFDSDLTQWVATVNTVNELITVGRDASGDRYFDGLMDDVGWFDEALDQTDRDNIRNNGVAALAADARLVAHWDFDQASGEIALDNKNGIQMLIATNGIVPFGPEFQTAAGQFGGALQFDGIDDFATFQDASFDVGRQGTLNFWINMDDTGRRNQFFEGPDNGGLEFQYRSNGGGQFFGRTQDGADFTIQQGGQSGVQGVWTNIQYTWDADTGEMHIYLDGSEEPYLSSFDQNLAGFDSTHFTDTINGLMNVGRDPGDGGRFFEGLMDDIGWFNDVLDQTDRDAIRVNGVADLAGDSRLVAHWNLDDAPGTTIVSGNSGTNIDLYIQAEPPLPPIEGFGVIAPLNSNVTFNAFNDNDLDSNVTLDNTNVFGDPLFAYESNPLFVNTPSLEEQFTIGFGSSAAYTSSEFASDTNTTTPHIGAFQNPPTLYPGVFGSGDIVIFGTDEDDLLELTFTSENTATFVLTRDVGGVNEVLETVILTDITSITFNGLGGDDVMIINQPDNQFANPTGGILFNGGSQNNNGNALGTVGLDGDTLVINHNTPVEADSVSYIFTPDAVPAEGEDGIITITDASLSDGSTTITFTGLEPIIDNLLVADRDFDFTDATETISLSDDGVAGDDYSFIDSTLSESVLFLNPTNSLTVRTDSVGTPVGVDTVQIDSLDSLFDASLTILAGSDDPVTFQTAVDLGTGDLFVTAESVDILADINAASTDISSSGVTSTTFNGGTVTTTGSQLYNNAVNFVTNSTLTSTGGSTIEFSSTVDGSIDLNIDTTGNTIFNGAIGSNTALTSLTTNAGGATNINGSTVNTTGNQTFNDAVILGDNTVLTSTNTGDITFNSTLNGAFTLNINTDGNTTFNDTVGNSAALTSLTTDANGTTNINGGSVTTTGNQTFNDAVLLGANTVLTSTAAGDIIFNSTLNGAFTLDINTGGNTTFNDSVGNSAALTSLTTDANGTTNINGGSINTTGNQVFNDAVVLGANTVLTSTTIGDIIFGSTLNGVFTLDINTDGNTTFNGTVGNSAALTSLTTDANGTTNINGGSVNTTGNQVFNDAVVLGANTVLTSTAIGDIIFGSTLNGAFTLDINTGGNTTFNDSVGNSAALTSLTTDANGTTNINGGSINTTGNQTFNDAVVLGANTILTSTTTGDILFDSTLNGTFTLDINTDGNTTFNDTVGNSAALTSLTTDANGTTNINGGSVNTTGNQIFNDAVVLGANTILTSTAAGDITFNSTLNGAFTLDINTDGNTTFNDAVGNNAALTSLTTDVNGTTNINGGSINTTGSQIFNDAVVLGANTVLTSTSTGDITFNSTLNGAFTLDINTDGNTTFNDTVGNSVALTSLTTDANGTTNINGGSVNTTGNQIFNDAVLLGANTVLTSTAAGDITFESTLNGAFTLNINTDGNTTFNDTVGNSNALTSLTTDANGTTNINGGSVNTTGNQIFNDAVVLGANTILTSTTIGDITFNSTLNGAFTLNINTDGNTTFNGSVGNNAALTSLTTNVNGTTNINGGSVTTTGNQTFNDAVVLGANTVLTSTAIGDIIFNSTLNGAFTLDINTDGNTTFNDAVGNNAALASLTTDANGTTNINGGSVNTTGSQIFNDAVVLGANTILTSTAAGDITFNSTLIGAFTLDVNTDGNTTFNDTVGNSAALTSLTTDVNGTTNINGGSVNTTGNQVFNDAVVLGANTILTSTAIGDITFNSTLNGAFTLDINTDGNTTFNDTVGNSVALTSLTTNANGTTNINGGSITTTGAQTYHDAVLLGMSTSFTSTTTGDITFNSSVTGGVGISVDISSTGDIILNDSFTTDGNVTATADSDTSGTGDFTMQVGSSLDAGSGMIDIDGANVVTRSLTTTNASATSITIDANNGNVTTRDTGVNSLGDISINATGMVTLEDDGVNTGEGGSVTIQAQGDITSTGAGIDTTVGTSSGGSIAVTSNAGMVDFSNSTVLTGNGGIIDIDASTGFTALNSSFTTTSGTGGGSVDVNVSAGNISITNGGITVNGSGTILLGAQGATADILIASELSSVDGGISVLADNDITLSSNARIVSQASGSITLTADNDGSNAGSITMDSGSTVESQGGLVQLSAYDNIAVSAITTTGGRVDITSTNGNITDNDGTTAKNVTANQLVLNSNTGIGQLADAIDTAISFLEADAGTGGLFLDNMGNLTIGNISAQVGLDADSDILVNVMGTLDITENVQSTTGSVELNATDTLTVDVATTIATFGTGALLLTSTRNIKLNNGSNLRTVNGGITLLANDGGVTAGDFSGIEAENATIETTGEGNILLTGFGGADALTSDHYGVHLHSGTSVTSTDTGASAGTITINGTGGTGIDNNRGVFIEGASTNITSVDGNVQIVANSSNGDGVLLADQAAVVSTGTGANAATITINGTTTSDNAGVTLTSNVQSLDGDIAITGSSTGGGTASEGVLIQTVAGQVNATNGNITIDGTSNGDDGIEISNSSGISITGTGNLQLLGESTGTGSGIEFNAAVNSNSGTVTFTSEDDVILGSVALIDSTSGTVTITADNAAGNNGNPISMANGALIDAGSGDINLTTDGNILLGGLLTTGTVNADSLSAAIIDNGDTHTDIIASTAVLNAVTGIGDGNPLETSIGTLSATVSDIGGLFIDNSIAVELLDVSTFDGEIVINATDTITATSVVSNNNSGSDSHDISLTATGTNSDILVTTITATGNADVTLTADDGILDTNGADANRITADNLMMTSTSAGGTQDGIDVDTSVNSVTAVVNTNAGGIRIDEVDDIILTQLTTADGPITVNAGGTIQVLNVVSENNSASDTNNGIMLTATGATSDIIITTLTAQNTADITLNSDRDILDSDSSDLNITSGDQLTAVAGRNIGGITSIFTETDFDPLQTSVDHLDLTSGNIIAIHNTGTTPELINLDAGTGTAGTTFIRATGGALDASLTTGISNTQDNIGFVSDTSITVPTGLQTSNLRLDAPDIIDTGGGNIDINAVNAILFHSSSAETVEITAQQFDGTATGSDFIIINDSPALELIDLNSDVTALTGGADTNIALTSAGGITVTNLIQVLGAGTLNLETTNTDADLVLNQNIQSGTGGVTISTANNIIFNGVTNLTSTSGSVLLTADADSGAGGLFGGITMADGSFINAGDGIVNLTATDDITIGHIVTTNATDFAIHLETDGSLIDAGDSTGEDLVANEVGARVTIIAALGAGKLADINGEIETQIDQVNITNQTSGEIQLIETDAVIIHDILQTTAGNISVVAGGNILLSGLIETTTGDVLLDTQGTIIDQNDGLPDPLNIHAVNLDLNAITGIGVGDTLELSVDTFSADTTNGDILLHNTATNSATASSISTGKGNIALEQIGNESLTIDFASTLDGNITISNEGDAQTDILTLTSTTAGGTTPEINVSTIGFGNILLGSVTGLDGIISVISAGEINDAVNDQAAPEIDLNAASGSITLQAINGIGNNERIELSGRTLSINTTTGNIDASNVSSLSTGPVGVSRLTTGNGTIDYLQTGGQDTTFEEITTTGSDITIETDGSILFENPGVLTDVVSTDGAGTVQVIATGVNSSIEINDGFRTAGGTIYLTAQNSLTFGSEGDINSSNGTITLLADSASLGAGGGGISMSDGTIFNAGTGTVDLQAGDDIAIGQLITTTLTRLTSTAGGVVDAGDSGGRDIIAEEVVLRTATGAGSADPLETAVSTLAALNTDSGHIQIHNDLGGALLTIGTVDGLAGVTNSANTPGDIFISNASPLTVNAPVTNSSGGNIGLESTGPGDLTLNASVRAFGGNGNINVNADDGFLAINDTGAASDHSVAGTGVFSGHGTSGVIIDNNTTLNSETGAIAGVPPVLTNLGTPQILATGDATVTGDFGRFTEQNFFITIDWGDGTVETFNFSDPGSFVFNHTYTLNPNVQNPAADIPILVTMQGDMQFTFTDGNGSLDFTSEAGLLETPGEGLANIAIDTTPQVPQLLFPQAEVILDSTSNQQSLFVVQDTLTIEGALQEANKNAERLVFLRILAPNGNLIEDVPLQETDLDNLPKLFKSLPDGRYQIYLKEAGEERIRLLMDVDIRGGKATDVTEDQPNQPSSTDNQNSAESDSTTQNETMKSPVASSSENVQLDTFEGVTTVINTISERTEFPNTFESTDAYTTEALQETYAPADIPEPNSHSNNTQTNAVEKAWSSSALLSGYFHGRSVFKKPTKPEEYESAMEKYGQRLMSRHYNIFRRN